MAASTTKVFSSGLFTLDNHAITELGKVLFKTSFLEGDLFKTCRRQTGVVNGEIIDFVDNMGAVGKTGRGCDPTYEDVTITGSEKSWSLGDWSIAKQICYKQLEDTIAQYCLNTGTSRDDVTSTEFWNKIYLPLLDKALTEMFWRIAWFGDTAAKNVASSGVITDGTATTLFTICDGLWKRLFAIAPSTSAQYTKIAANTDKGSASAITTAIQKQNIRTLESGKAALNLLDNVLADANSLIASNGGILMMTNSIYQAYRRQYRDQYKETIPFMEAAGGVQLPSYDGVPVLVVPEWDNLISTYESKGTYLNNPHRLVFANPENLLVGTSATSELAEFDTFFAKKERMNYTYAASNLGTLVKEDHLVHVAY